MPTKKKPSAAEATTSDASVMVGAEQLGSLEKACRTFVPGLGKLRLVEAVPSAITTGWGVRWDEEMVARDLMQNFRDASKHDFDSVETRSAGRAACISGPEEFDLRRLYYVGSEKSAEQGDIGLYGEGFKAASIGLLRDFGVSLAVISDQQLVRIRLGDEVAGTEMRRLEYDYFEHDGAVKGAHLVIDGASPTLKKALLDSKEQFFWPGNPLLGEVLQDGRGVAIYRSTKADGAGFYLGLKRLSMRGVPFVLVLKKQVKTIDNKIAQDRDRKAFNDAVATAFYNAVGREYTVPVVNTILEATRALWPQGHGLLAGMGKAVGRGVYRRTVAQWEDARKVFRAIGEHDQYFRHTRYLSSAEEYGKQSELEKTRTRVPEYFVAFGVMNATDIIQMEKDKHYKAVAEASSTRPTVLEQRGIELLQRTTSKLAGGQVGWVSMTQKFQYLVAHTDEILGMLQTNRGYGSHTVVLAASVFTSSLSRALAVIMHEMAHTFGHDGSHQFSDALTHMLERVLGDTVPLDEERAEWGQLQEAVIAERMGLKDSARERLLGMAVEELRSKLLQCDEALLLQLEGMDPEAAKERAEEIRRAVEARRAAGPDWLERIPRDSVQERVMRQLAAVVAGFNQDAVNWLELQENYYETSEQDNLLVGAPSGEVSAEVVGILLTKINNPEHLHFSEDDECVGSMAGVRLGTDVHVLMKRWEDQV